MDIRLIGTSHIARQSIQEIKKALKEEKPDIVALELDVQRAAALLEKRPSRISPAVIRQIGLKGYLFAKIGQLVQQRLGKMVGVAPGSEMKTAIEEARKLQLQVALIDQPIAITLQKFSRSLTWKEKFRFMADLLKGIFFPKKQLRELGLENFDLRTVPEQELIKKMMQYLRQRYPSIYKTLVEERNRYMVKQLVQLQRVNSGKKILAIVGAGHVEGMTELLRKIDIVR